jgi:hypothetical protein
LHRTGDTFREIGAGIIRIANTLRLSVCCGSIGFNREIAHAIGLVLAHLINVTGLWSPGLI